VALAEEWRAACRHELPRAVALRHQLHQAPRVAGDESDTAELLATAVGAGDGRVVAGTGRLLAVTVGGAGPAVAVRTELDGLPVAEQTEVPWASRNGSMHACGHDVHMAALVAVARAAARVGTPGPLLALLQPREEGADSGAADVVAEGGLDGIEAVLAAHVQPQLPPGVVGVTPGAVNAGSDEFSITVRGQGGHSGYPHTVDDSVLALSAIVVSLQQLAARRIDPVVGVACMVNQLRAGTANNVVPDVAVGSGTVRTMGPRDRERAHRVLGEIATHVAAAHGCTVAVEITHGEPPLLNDVRLAVDTAVLLSGFGHEVTTDFRSFGADDFSSYGARARSLMMFVGTGASGGRLHDAGFLPDDDYVALVADALIAGCCAAYAG
jgi:amidohydrolase